MSTYSDYSVDDDSDHDESDNCESCRSEDDLSPDDTRRQSSNAPSLPPFTCPNFPACSANGPARCCYGTDQAGAMRYLLRSAEFSDVKITAALDTRSRVFSVHKLVLASHSGVFARMFYSSFKEASTKDPIELDTSVAALEKAVNFMYGHRYSCANSAVELELWAFAHKYGLEFLAAKTAASIASHPDFPTCYLALNMAKGFESSAVVSSMLAFISREISCVDAGDIADICDAQDIATVLSNVLVDRMGLQARARACAKKDSPCVNGSKRTLHHNGKCCRSSKSTSAHHRSITFRCAADHDQMTCFSLVEGWILFDPDDRRQYADVLLSYIDLTLVGKHDIKEMCASPLATMSPRFVQQVAAQVGRGSEYEVKSMTCKFCRKERSRVRIYVGKQWAY